MPNPSRLAYIAFNSRRDTHGKYKCNEAHPETTTIDGGKFKMPTASRLACTAFNDRRDSHGNYPHLDSSSVDNLRNPKGVRQQVSLPTPTP